MLPTEHSFVSSLKRLLGLSSRKRRVPSRRRGERARRKCRFGRLKHPVGKRVCRKKRRR